MIPLNVLVVDDSLLTIKKIEAMLNEMGHTVVKTAQTGLEAIDAYGVCNPDLVTLDITMPDMDGLTAIKEIMARWPDANVIMVTSNGLESMVLDAIQSGAKGYVLKPIKHEKLQEQIKRIFKF